MLLVVLLCVFAVGFVGGSLYGYWVGKSSVRIPVHVPVRTRRFDRAHGRK